MEIYFWQFRNDFVARDVWNLLECNWLHFFWLTGESPATLSVMVNRIEQLFLPQIQTGRVHSLSFRNQVRYIMFNILSLLHRALNLKFFQHHVTFTGATSFYPCNFQMLLTMIWLRRYPTMEHLATHFGISVSCTHRLIHKCLILLHAYTVPKYIKWHNMQTWRNMAGSYPEWPRVIAILDCTPFRISRPKGSFHGKIWK